MDLTNFIVGLFLLLAASVLVGEIATRLGQAALVGQLVVGVLLGPTLLGPALGLSSSTPGIAGIQFLATFFILVMAGLEISPEEIYATGLSAGLLGLSIFLIPFSVGALVVHLIYPALPFLTGLFVSLTLSITALPVMGVMLSEFHIGRTKMGVLLLNTAVINELAAVTVFAVLLRFQTGSGAGWVGPAIALLSVALFVTSVLAFHQILKVLRELRRWDALRQRFRDTWKSKEAGFAILLIMALGAALYSQYLGLTFLVGAFYAGLLITPESAGRREHRSISQIFDAITWGFFIPLFFAFVGLGMNLRTIGSSWTNLAEFALLCVFAIFSKYLVGAYVAGRLGWPKLESRSIGFLVSSRGAVELAMAVILLQLGVFSTEVYTVVAGVGLVTTVVAPIGAARYGRFPKEEEESAPTPRPTTAAGATSSRPPVPVGVPRSPSPARRTRPEKPPITSDRPPLPRGGGS